MLKKRVVIVTLAIVFVFVVNPLLLINSYAGDAPLNASPDVLLLRYIQIISYCTCFKEIFDKGATTKGNFSIVTLLWSRPNPFSSLRLLSLIQK